ncbi:cytochrome b/b6 domain-containing protein [Variovorax dokdonensis]|uniref:Cytochrome b/b6 domain-containing protein n=1 Tax=Variovorax dokdonensis TaxID=344883 RepID=A0ABT7NDT9_9BURK|nr:cytochrome b/b6 domain-containing protein [Variovorax dokdonensis]MDM0045995.1 cytochrome b/b6 domain-containing protein [Variovorax dokdonensis]
MKKSELLIWDWPVRALHWLLALAVISAWILGGSSDTLGEWHEWLGLSAGGVVALRLAWGFLGRRHARFGQFVRSPRSTIEYARAAWRGHAPRYLGHNPLGGWMVVALLSCVAGLALSGWLYTTEWLWGYEWLYDIHFVLGWLLVALVALHLAGVLVTGWKHGENLVRAMVTGRKAAPSGDDVE